MTDQHARETGEDDVLQDDECHVEFGEWCCCAPAIADYVDGPYESTPICRAHAGAVLEFDRILPRSGLEDA